MTKRFSILAAALLTGVAAADWRADLAELVRTEPGARQQELLSEVLAAEPAWRDVAAALAALPFDEAEAGAFELRRTLCADGVERPWVLYVPPSYDAETPTPFLVVLHGGVSWPDIPEDPLAETRKDEWAAPAAEYGWLVLYPFGQKGATWWDEVGMANIRNLVRTVKREYNVDDDRVYMGGFSDGASAAFCWAMVEPTAFAGFVALNGHMGVGSLDGGLDTYAPNFFNTPVYAVTTFDDPLYPSAKMRATIEMAQRAGGDVFYRELAGTHDFTYAESEIPLIARWMARHPRDPFPARIVWEAATPEFGRCRWLRIDEITEGDAAAWHDDFNVERVDDRIAFGFYPGESEGAGVPVSGVVDESPAAEAGLAEGDVIVGIAGKAVNDVDDVNAWKEAAARGDAFTLRVKRGDAELTLEGRFPPAENYLIFKRERPSARAEATVAGNCVDVRGSRLGAFTVYVHPDMFNLDENVTITVDGDVAFDAKVKPDAAFMLRDFLERRDRKALYVNAVRIDL
jgi:poly(3-hydroxybutyrate) depolymerase